MRPRWAAEITGPITVALSVGSPTLRKPAIWTSPSATWSKTLRCTTARVGAVQIWPEWNDQVEPMHPTAPFTSASSNTMQAPLPPSSSRVRFIVRAAFSAMVTPTWVEPVKLTQSTSSESTSAADEAGVLPLTRLTTPGGKPTSLRMRTSSTMASGSWGAGLTTTALPAASAGATFPAMLTMGKLYEVTQAITPMAWRLTKALMMPPGAKGVAWAVCGTNEVWSTARGSREYRSKRSAATGTCMREPTVAVAPVSAMTSGRRSADLARMAAAASRMRALRSSWDQAAQAGWASLAAAAAARASSALALGARPTTSSVAGLMTS